MAPARTRSDAGNTLRTTAKGELPSGTVTFLFTDIEGSTQLWEHYPRAMSAALARHDSLLQEAIEGHGGVVFATGGDAFCAAFATASAAVAAACDGTRAFEREPWPEHVRIRVRMALHTGVAETRGRDYFGQPLNRIARLLAAGHGGQVLISLATRELLRDRLPAGVTLRDMGERRLKDLVRPEHVYQIVMPEVRADFPALRTLDARAHNLPIQSTSFVGREREMEHVKALLGSSRLVTLAGSGGAGKTRLALQVGADRIDDFADGVWLVELAPLAEASLVTQEAASALGVREEGGVELLATLVKALKHKELLLLLDNCEHLIDASARLCEALIAGCANVRILATSREVLRVPGEATFRVPSLAVPDPAVSVAESLTQYAAVRLFVDRAVAVQSTFRVDSRNAPAVASICFHLDGIPLAIELAAARVRSMSVNDMRERLDQRFRLLTGGARTALPRQRTLRAAIDWSYDLLSVEEQALFRRLAVFAGGWTLEAVDRVFAGDGAEAGTTLDLLASLVDKSLILSDESASRYRFLETVHQYARERLIESGEEVQWRNRQLAYCLALGEEAESQLRGRDQHGWLDRLETEHDNLRAALTFASSPSADPVHGLRLATAIWWFWNVRGYFTEGRRWLSAMAGAAPDGVADRIRAHALHGAGGLAWQQGDYLESRALFERSLAIRRSVGDQERVADSLTALGLVAKEQTQYERARLLHEESLSIQRELGNRRGVATALGNLASVSLELGKLVDARAQYAESLEIFRNLGDEVGIAIQVHNLGCLSFDQGDYAAAQLLHEQSLAIRRALRDRSGVAAALAHLGVAASAQGDYGRALLLEEESLEIRKALGDQLGIAFSLYFLGEILCDRGDLVRARALCRESLSISGPLRYRLCVVGGLESLAACLSDPSRAAILWGGAERLRREIDAPIAPGQRSRYAARVAKTRAASGNEAAFDEAWRQGRAMTTEQIIEYALEADAPE